MTSAAAIEKPDDFDRTVELLGGRSMFGHPIGSRLDAHKRIQSGFPVGAIKALANAIGVVRNDNDFQNVLGISKRTLYRKDQHMGDAKPLSSEQSSKAWSIAEIFALAERVHGKDEAQRWMETPAYALDGEAPINLLTTSAGLEAVETYLKQIEYGIYV